MKVKQLIELLRESYDPEEQVCSVIWSHKDVELCRKRLGLEGTRSQSYEVLAELDRKQDNSQGVTWQDLKQTVEEYHANRK